MNATILIHGKPVSVVLSKSAMRELGQRTQPLIVELELYFSCLVKKFVHFHEVQPARETVAVSDKLSIFFRSVTSTACTLDVAERFGRQPEIELDNPHVNKLAPKLVNIDFIKGKWQGTFAM